MTVTRVLSPETSSPIPQTRSEGTRAHSQRDLSTAAAQQPSQHAAERSDAFVLRHLQRVMAQSPRVQSLAQLRAVMNRPRRPAHVESPGSSAHDRPHMPVAKGVASSSDDRWQTTSESPENRPAPTTADGDEKATLQRKIGFEFEVEAPLYHSPSDPVVDFFIKKRDTEFSKDHEIYRQAEFHIVQDHSAAGNDGIWTIPEFVVHPESEDMYLDDFLANVQAAYEFVKASKGGVLKLGDGLFVGTPIASFNEGSVGGGQATFGVRPEGVEHVFGDKMRRTSDRSSPLREHEILSRSVESADLVMQSNVFAAIKGKDDEPKIKGFILLICQYCVSNSIAELQNGPALDKNKVPFLVRSTMGAVATATLSDNARRLLAANEQALTALIIDTTKARKGTPIIRPTTADAEAVSNVNVEEWVPAALKGVDTTLNWGGDRRNVDSKIIQPEETGSLINSRDRKRSMGAVMEERNLEMGPIAVRNWVKYAADVWKVVCQANQKTQ